MSVAIEPSKGEDVGEILVKVQEDLNRLKNQVLGGQSGNVDISALEHAIAKTEQGIKSKSEQWIQHLNNRVLTLPPGQGAGQARDHQVAIETTWDLRTNTRGSVQVRRTGPESYGLLEPRALGQPNTVSLTAPQTRTLKQPVQLAGLTPGQKTKIGRELKAMANPQNTMNRRVMHDSYNVQLPQIKPDDQKPPVQRVVLGSNVEPLAILPLANRVDATLLPPPIGERDARQGILSLIERGLIPPAAELTLEPNPVRHKPVTLHDPEDRHREVVPLPADMTAGVRLDPGALEVRPRAPRSAKKRRSLPQTQPASTLQDDNKNKMIVPPPTTPASSDFRAMNYRFAIHHGKVRESSSEFVAFKQHYCLSWGSIVHMLKHLERLCSNYAVPIAFINGDRLADLALEFELEKQPGEADLLSVIINRDDVEALIHKPGRRLLGPHGPDLAAMKIQAAWRGYVQRRKYLEYRRRKWAAGVIAISWLLHVKMSMVRKHLRFTRADQLEIFRARNKVMAENWERIQTGRRLIVHLPSLGHSPAIRTHLSDLPIRQNTQMARLCDIQDPNVDVVYISPVAVGEETQQYYSKLLGLGAAVVAGDASQVSDVRRRFTVLVPEALTSFPAHNMCLSTLLKYSPRTLKRLSNLVKGREAYIVPGLVNKDDVSISDYLGLPVLGPEPEVAQLYSTKSGAKRIFATAEVKTPPTEYDVYSLQQLHDCLASLVTEHLSVTKWLFKIDDENDGRGIAVCHVAQHLSCYSWAVKEARRYGDKWSKKWAQEAAFHKISAEIPEIVKNHSAPAHTDRYPTWEKFLEAFLSRGGVIEAVPPSEHVTTLKADLLLEPTGRWSLVAVGDQIHADSLYRCWGVSIPQSSVEPEDLNTACSKIAEACRARGVLGYFSVDFATFIDAQTEEQELWALDLSLRYSDSLGQSRLFDFVTGGKLDPATHLYNIPPPKPEKRKRRPKKFMKDEEPPNTNRYAVCSTRLLHTNLSLIHYSVFFQMCRAHGVGYDVKEKAGTVFTLNDGYHREHMGMLVVGDSLQGSLVTFARNLSVVHQEISAPNMQGTSNFQAVIKDIESILNTTILNCEEGDPQAQETPQDQASQLALPDVTSGGETQEVAAPT